MRIRFVAPLCLGISLTLRLSLAGQAHNPVPAQHPQENADAVNRGRLLFQSNCGFCHGNDATGSRAPDLVRSAILSHDQNGDLVGPVIHNGRPDKGMPAFSNLQEDRISDIISFLHHQATAALHSARVPTDYPVAKLLTGSAAAGKAFFTGAGGCSECHSVTGDLSGIAARYAPIDLQQHMVYPSSDKKNFKTAIVTLRDGTRYEGKLMQADAFSLAIICQDGWYRSWSTDQVTFVVHDPLEAHRELMTRYTDTDIHNLFAYLITLK